MRAYCTYSFVAASDLAMKAADVTCPECLALMVEKELEGRPLRDPVDNGLDDYYDELRAVYGEP